MNLLLHFHIKQVRHLDNDSEAKNNYHAFC